MTNEIKNYYQMKKMTMTMAGVMIFILGHTQEKPSGEITYLETRKIEIRLSGADEALASQLPREQKTNTRLLFTPEKSLYGNDPNTAREEVTTSGEEGQGMMVSLVRPENKIFTDFVKLETVEQRDFMSRMLLIEEKLDPGAWKLTGKQKTILDYPCQEAIRQQDTITTVAWFTPAIPVSTGPGRYQGLPGLVLAVDIDNDHRTIQATGVKLGSIDASEISRPKEGKKVSQEEYNRIVEEKRKEMNAQYGGSGGVVVIRR